MVDPRRSQADSDGMVFGYLGVRISESAVWTSKHGYASRYLARWRVPAPAWMRRGDRGSAASSRRC
jgi:hypothetical protein